MVDRESNPTRVNSSTKLKDAGPVRNIVNDTAAIVIEGRFVDVNGEDGVQFLVEPEGPGGAMASSARRAQI